MRVTCVSLFFLAAVLAACASPPAPAPAPPASPAPPPTTVAPAPTSAPASPADGTDVSACADGVCAIEVRGPVDVPLTAFGVTRWHIEPDPDGLAWEIQPGDAVGQVNGGTGGRPGSTDDAAAGAVQPEVGEVFAGGIIMRLVTSDGSRAVVEFRRGAPTVS